MMISDLKKHGLTMRKYDRQSVQFSSVQKIIQTIDDKYYNNRSILSAPFIPKWLGIQTKVSHPRSFIIFRISSSILGLTVLRFFFIAVNTERESLKIAILSGIPHILQFSFIKPSASLIAVISPVNILTISGNRQEYSMSKLGIQYAAAFLFSHILKHL